VILLCVPCYGIAAGQIMNAGALWYRWLWRAITAAVVAPRRLRVKTSWFGSRCPSLGSTCSALNDASSTAQSIRPLVGQAASRALNVWPSWHREFCLPVWLRSPPDSPSTNTYTKQSSGESTSYRSATKVGGLCIVRKISHFFIKYIYTKSCTYVAFLPWMRWTYRAVSLGRFWGEFSVCFFSVLWTLLLLISYLLTVDFETTVRNGISERWMNLYRALSDTYSTVAEGRSVPWADTVVPLVVRYRTPVVVNSRHNTVYTRVGLTSRSALQSQKWQQIGMS